MTMYVVKAVASDLLLVSFVQYPALNIIYKLSFPPIMMLKILSDYTI